MSSFENQWVHVKKKKEEKKKVQTGKSK